jgi:hypothetical protein
MRTNTNYQDVLKVIAIVAMIIDHLGLYIFPDNILMRLIGRVAMPLFCFFAGYNFNNKIRPQLLLYGALLYAITLVIYNDFTTANILISIFLGQIYLYLFHNQLKTFNIAYIHVVVLTCLWIYTFNITDYGTLSVAIMVLGYVAKHEPASLKIVSVITQYLSVLHTVVTFEPNNYQLALVIFIALIVYMLMTIRNFNNHVGFNFVLVSRNSLFIYYVQAAVIQIIWFYRQIA